MKKIIVPIDFSAASKNAFAYACAFVENSKHTLKVVHIGEIESLIGVTLPSFIDEIRNRQKRKLDQFVKEWQVDRYAKNEKVFVIEQEVVMGKPAKELIRMSKEEDCDFIIMGTTGSKGPLQNFLGTISTSVSQKAHCPVWLIPPSVSFVGFDSILYAGNYESAETKTLNAIIKLSNDFESKIHLVHINNPEKNSLNWKFEELILDQLFKKKAADLHVELHTVHHESFWQGINEYVLQKGIDLIVMVTHHRKFWDRLYHKSMTKSMLLHTKVPMLVLHLEDAVLTEDGVEFTQQD